MNSNPTCPRGDHGPMRLDGNQPLAYRCWTCGSMHYPAYVDNVPDDPGSGAQHRLSKRALKARRNRIRNIMISSPTISNSEMQELTGYAMHFIGEVAAKVRREIGE